MIEQPPKFYETAGYNAFRLGLNSFNAPYKPGDKRLKHWMAGYSRAKAENAKQLEVSAANRPVVYPNIDRNRNFTNAVALEMVRLQKKRILAKIERDAKCAH